MCPARARLVKGRGTDLSTVEQPPAADEAAGEPALEHGSFAPASPPAPTQQTLTVVTFNIRYAVGSFLITGSLARRAGLARPARRGALVGGNISKAARALSDGARMPPADVVALQEADRRTLRAGRRHVARELAESLRMNYVHAAVRTPRGEAPKDKQWYLNFEEPIAPGDEGDTGVAILSRLPLEGAARVELPWSECAWRPRLALAATVPFGGRRLHLFNSHIDPHAALEGQLEQHRAVLRAAAGRGAGDAVALLGDFNTLIPRAREAMRALLESHGYATPQPSGVGTWRAGPLRLHADWIFVRGARVRRWGVARRLSVSDHWPVWAEIEPCE